MQQCHGEEGASVGNVSNGTLDATRLTGECRVSLLLILIILLVVLGGGGFYAGGPRFGGGAVGLIIIIIIVLALTGRL